MEEEIELLNNAFEKYNLDSREDISDKILDYIADRLLINKLHINRLIEVLECENTFEEIWNTFENARAEKEYYKKSQDFRKFSDNYYMGIYATSKGNLVIETDSVLNIIKYFVMAIKSRNTITISKVNYSEVSIESVLLVIFCEALNKFGLDRNLLMIMPFEECYYENFDEVIIEENGNLIKNRREFSNKYIIYIEDEKFRLNAEDEKHTLENNGLEYEIIEGEFYDVIDKINKIKPIGACIYTSIPEQGYKFINLVHSNNVFVNTSLMNSEDFSKDNNLYYLKKKIIYPMINYGKNENNIIENKIDSNNTNLFNSNKNIEDVKLSNSEKETVNNNEFALITPKANPWYKRIFEAIKKFFTK